MHRPKGLKLFCGLGIFFGIIGVVSGISVHNLVTKWPSLAPKGQLNTFHLTNFISIFIAAGIFISSISSFLLYNWGRLLLSFCLVTGLLLQAYNLVVNYEAMSTAPLANSIAIYLGFAFYVSTLYFFNRPHIKNVFFNKSKLENAEQ